ncbi:hypothetical protein [Candidatus Avelusimicrobium gallicola]|uniref:Uncharacterized protein n=1 Tax=Candidatus Avelusimicrobium gallicola TaxID=2562704 RepID=A0A1Y4DAS0_9BACT|nr:hypothetical protein [Elusimicrobium sp. An273]OUO56303.1 hypothetical protein B5F75_06725 [Elusimicrobium sp. An273]
MRKVSFLFVAFILMFTAGFAGDKTTREATYKQLVAQRQELLAWETEHPMAPKLMAMYKTKEAREIRQQLYQNFPDLRRQEISQFRKELRQELQKSQTVPFVTFNTLPLENLKKLTANKKLLLEFLKAYPDNAVNLTDEYLLRLFQEDEALEEMMTSYLLYLKIYHANPAAARLSSEQQKMLQTTYQMGNMPRMYNLLFSYASAGLSKARRELARQYVRNSLVSAFTK